MSEARVQSAGGRAVPSCCLDDLGILGAGDADASGDAEDVSIHRQSRDAERVAKDDVGGLAAHAGQLHQFVHRPRHFAAMRVDDLGRHPEQRARLGAEETCRLDLRLEFVGGRPGERRGVGVALEQGRRDLVHPLVSALRREDGRDQQLIRVLEVQLGVGIGMLRREGRKDFACLRGRLRRLGIVAFAALFAIQRF